MRSKRPAKKVQSHHKDVKDIVYSEEAETRGDVPFIACSNIPKGMRSKRHARITPVHPKEAEDIVRSDEVKTCSADDHTEPNLENQSSTSPCKNPESWTINGDYTEDNCENCTSNRNRTRERHCGRKLNAKNSLEYRKSQDSSRKSFVDGEVVGSSFSRTVSKKQSNKSGKLSRNIRGAEPSENKLKTKMSKPGSLSTGVESLESQDGDNIILASFVHNKSKKRGLKCTKNASRASFSSTTTVVSKQIDNQNPSGEQDGLSGGTEDLVMEENAASHRLVRKPENVNMLTGDDDDNDDMTLACLMGNKSKKWSQAATGHRACSSSKSKKGSILLPEVQCANKAIVIADGNGLSMSKLVEEQSVLHGGEAEPTNLNVEEENELLATFLRNKAKRERRKAKSHGGNC